MVIDLSEVQQFGGDQHVRGRDLIYFDLEASQATAPTLPAAPLTDCAIGLHVHAYRCTRKLDLVA
jgi:hypothetical protein